MPSLSLFCLCAVSSSPPPPPGSTRRGSVCNPSRLEFLCPLCKSIGNALVPVAPSNGDGDGDGDGDGNTLGAAEAEDHNVPSIALISPADAARVLDAPGEPGALPSEAMVEVNPVAGWVPSVLNDVNGAFWLLAPSSCFDLRQYLVQLMDSGATRAYLAAYPTELACEEDRAAALRHYLRDAVVNTVASLELRDRLAVMTYGANAIPDELFLSLLSLPAVSPVSFHRLGQCGWRRAGTESGQRPRRGPCQEPGRLGGRLSRLGSRCTGGRGGRFD